MNVIFDAVLISVFLAGVMLGAIELGFRLGSRGRSAGEQDKSRTGAVEGAIFALFGLLVAFNFSSAAGRMDARRQLVIDEANAVGTAWLRLDLLSADQRTTLRSLMKEYTAHRIAVHQAMPDWDRAEPELAKVSELQTTIWKLVMDATRNEPRPQIATLVVPAMNDMFDIGSKRFYIARFHTPWVMVGALLALAVLASFLAGHAMSHRDGRPWLHILLFVAVVAGTIYITLDMEFPRSGLINIRSADESLIRLRDQLPD